MVMQGFLARRWVRGLGLAGVAAAGYVAGTTTEPLAAQPPAGTTAPAPPADKRVVAYVYGNIPVNREELGDFLIARGGYEKLDLLVNKRIIEIEAAKRRVSVTDVEVQAALESDLRGMGLTLEDFKDKVLPRYRKTLYEWLEDVIKPRLLLGKMCKDGVKVTEEDLKKAFDNKYGEKRQPKIICWNKEDIRIAEKQWAEARNSDADFDRVARAQVTPSLAAATGLIAPIGKYPDVEDETCTKELYSLKQVGDITGLFKTPAGIMCMKLVAIIPADPTVYKLTDQKYLALRAANVPDLTLAKIKTLRNKEFSRGDLAGELLRSLTVEELAQFQNLILTQCTDHTTTFEQMRPAIEREMQEKKMTSEIPKFFTELKERAQPMLLLKGPPSPAEIRDATNKEYQDLTQTGGVQPPAPKK
jgi:hypothetical protein